MAVAVAPAATTRWSEVTLPAGPAAGWLVPIRPGASIEWASGAWLSSLDVASAPRVLPPTAPTSCRVRTSYEMPSQWVTPRARLPASTITLHLSVAETEAWAQARGLEVGAAQGGRLDELYASGWQVAAIELAASDAARTSPTLRVTDDGGPVLPLSLGASELETAVTLFVIGAGHAKVAGARDVERSKVLWGPARSSYEELREETLLRTSGWLRESTSHAALFDDVPLKGVRVRPVAATYFDDPDCAASVQRLGSRTVAEGPSMLTCGAQTDLAVALAGIAPADANLTRLIGVLPASGDESTSVALESGPQRSAVFAAAGYEACDPNANGANGANGADPRDPIVDRPDWPSGPTFPSSPSKAGSTSASSDDTSIYVPGDGCGGGVVVSDTASDDDWTTSDSSDSCSSDTSSSDGWDTSDTSDSSDSCSSDTGDGWDTSDSETCATAKRRRRGPSLLSRVVIFAVAILLPLRRRLRPASGERS
ncbi:MAG: hypothetical protein KIT84_30360 [Labilithrix sp.]|nr:hypothetical protein [Labilithrix sp.]MCW5815369.1 hypothetical protein [Labilithrix sp.]